ncbi:MAG: AEC family transporter, partial [Anaeroplasmataceae bacterium]|nr:AEC family transporter [Anaeroplasmataceae bacterium]
IIGVAVGLVVCGINMIINSNGGNVEQFLNDYVKFIPSTIESLAKIATPLALIVLGGKFEFTAVKKLWKQLTFSVTLRLFITPAIFLVIAYFIGFKGSTQFAILISLFATPIAVSSAPMAAQMGQDEELAGQIVVWTSAISAFSLFAIIMICASIGIF